MSNVHFQNCLTVAAENAPAPGAVYNGATKQSNEKSNHASKEKTGIDSLDSKDNHPAKRQKKEEEDFVDLICPITRVTTSNWWLSFI